MRKRRLFISHAWHHSGQYCRLLETLRDRPNLEFYHRSVPAHDPLDVRTTTGLERKLRDQMRNCHAVIALAGVYATCRVWIRKELFMALAYNKPVVAVRPRGQQGISQVVQDSADRIVGWNTESIAGAICEVAP